MDIIKKSAFGIALVAFAAMLAGLVYLKFGILDLSDRSKLEVNTKASQQYKLALGSMDPRTEEIFCHPTRFFAADPYYVCKVTFRDKEAPSEPVLCPFDVKEEGLEAALNAKLAFAIGNGQRVFVRVEEAEISAESAAKIMANLASKAEAFSYNKMPADPNRPQSERNQDSWQS